MQVKTSVSEKIRKSPLVKAQTALRKQKNKIKYGEKRFSMWRMEFLHPAMWHDHIDFARWLHPATWHVALWWHVIEFARWQHPAMWHWHVALRSWHWIRQVWWQQVAPGWHVIEFAQTTAIIRILYFWIRFWPYHRSRHVFLYQSAKFYLNRTTLNRKNDVMSIFKSLILGVHNGFFEKPMYDFLYVVNKQYSSKLLSLWENRHFAFWRQTDKQTDR